MSKNIELKPGAHLSGALVKRKDLQHRRASEDLLAQAKKRAKQLCSGAEQQAEAVRQQGYRAGYAEGLQSSVTAVIEGVQRLADMHQQFEQGLQTQVRAVLEPMFAADEMLLSVIDGLVQLEPAPEPKRIRIYWPAFAGQARQSIVQRLASTGLDAQVLDAPDGRRLVVEWGEHLWEFDAASALNTTMDAVTLSLKHSIGLQEACAEVRQQVFEGLLSELSRVVKPSQIN